MESSGLLNISLAQYSPESECYIVSEYLRPKLAPSHIIPKEKTSASENGHESAGKEKERVRLIYAEQMLYLSYIAEYQQFQTVSAKTSREEWEALKREDIMIIYGNLSQKGYNRLQFVHFYLKMRKKSRLVEREYSPNDHQFIPLYRIYKTVDDFKQKVKAELVYLVYPNEILETILMNKDRYHKESPAKMHILSNLDGMGVVIKPSFPIVDNTLRKRMSDN